MAADYLGDHLGSAADVAEHDSETVVLQEERGVLLCRGVYLGWRRVRGVA